MQISHFNRIEAELFTSTSDRLTYDQESLIDFIQQPFSLEAFAQQIELKSQTTTTEMRQTLVEGLKLQYSAILPAKKVNDNMASLSEKNTFTVTTGHQLSLLTGPIYFIYKIFHVIRLAEKLKEAYPKNHFVPVFWMASEDHDFEEVQSVSLFNKTLTWSTTQKGAVGRFLPEGFEDVMTEVRSFFSNNPESEVIDALAAYQGVNASEGMLRLVNKLFESYGLVVLDGDSRTFKKQFVPLVKRELTEQFSFKEVALTDQRLERKEIKLQATPREINLFYLSENSRERIIKNGDMYDVSGVGSFTEEELMLLVDNEPERFSPNVILRPVYQETILPNLCYVGGGGEMAYWLQLKGVFDAANCVYPLIQVRNSLLLIDGPIQQKMEKVGMELQAIFTDTEELKKSFVAKNSENDLDFSTLDEHWDHVVGIMQEKALDIDKNLEKFSMAEVTKIEKQLEFFKQKLIKTEKTKFEQSLKNIEQIKEKLFPNGLMQERSLNFFNLCSDGQVQSNLDTIFSSIDPFMKDLIVVEMD
jgi:bacillithiol biosynthesis cysteine-adding enzyme BshC